MQAQLRQNVRAMIPNGRAMRPNDRKNAPKCSRLRQNIHMDALERSRGAAECLCGGCGMVACALPNAPERPQECSSTFARRFRMFDGRHPTAQPERSRDAPELTHAAPECAPDSARMFTQMPPNVRQNAPVHSQDALRCLPACELRATSRV